jgi:hypothetical protein
LPTHCQRAAITQKYASAKLTRLDVNRSETAILMEAMLRAHDVLAVALIDQNDFSPLSIISLAERKNV